MTGNPGSPVKRRLPEQSVISGSFSKITAPGMRIGWLYAPKEILSAFNTVKQAADLHSNFLCQQILYRYLTTHDLDAHIHRIVEIYGRQCRLMCDLFDDLMPALSHTTPAGGMFLTATLPDGLHAMKVFEEGIRQKIAVLPGMPFYVDGGGTDMIRLNFSNADEEKILRRNAPARRGCQRVVVKNAGSSRAGSDRRAFLSSPPENFFVLLFSGRQCDSRQKSRVRPVIFTGFLLSQPVPQNPSFIYISIGQM